MGCLTVESEQAVSWTMGGAYLKAEKRLPQSERLKYQPIHPCPHAKAACNALLMVKGQSPLEEGQTGGPELDAHAPHAQMEAMDWLDKVLNLGPEGERWRLEAVKATRYDPI